MQSLHLNSLKLYDVTLELYAIQIGGFYNNEEINEARNNNFLITTCTLDTLNECVKYVDKLTDYFTKDFDKQKKRKIKNSSFRKSISFRCYRIFITETRL